MPKWTNDWKLPLPIALAWQHDDYQALQDSLRTKLNAPMFSVTTLIGPPQVGALYRRHGENLTLDVIQRTHIQAGKGIDAQLDRAQLPGLNYSHCRFVTGIHHPEIGPVYISFEPDLVYERIFEDREDGFRLVDLKDTKVMAVKNNEIKVDWRWQLRSYRYLLQLGNTYQCLWDADQRLYRLVAFNPIRVTRTSLCARLKDWSRHEAYTKGGVHQGYPPCEFVIIDQPNEGGRKEVEDRVVRNYLMERIKLHHSALSLPDDKLPECTEEDRWAKPSVWAVVYLDGKSKGKAYRGGSAFRTRPEAERFMREKEPGSKNKLTVEYRPGEQTRCQHWCDVSQVCQQFERIRKTSMPF